jgi:hypothetical protein
MPLPPTPPPLPPCSCSDSRTPTPRRWRRRSVRGRHRTRRHRSSCSVCRPTMPRSTPPWPRCAMYVRGIRSAVRVLVCMLVCACVCVCAGACACASACVFYRVLAAALWLHPRVGSRGQGTRVEGGGAGADRRHCCRRVLRPHCDDVITRRCRRAREVRRRAWSAANAGIVDVSCRVALMTSSTVQC